MYTLTGPPVAYVYKGEAYTPEGLTTLLSLQGGPPVTLESLEVHLATWRASLLPKGLLTYLDPQEVPQPLYRASLEAREQRTGPLPLKGSQEVLDTHLVALLKLDDWH